MALIHALYLHDSVAANAAIKKGEHPLHYIEHAVQLRDRSDVLTFLLSFVHGADRDCIVRVRDHLEFLDRYPMALAELNRWLTVHVPSVSPSIQLLPASV